MNFLIGIRTDDYVIMASDKNVFAYGAMSVSEEHSKEIELGDRLYMLCVGEPGDVSDFGNWAQANLRLYKTRNGYELNPKSTHFWLRQNIAESLRTEDFWRVNLLVGGYDKFEGKAFLGHIDYLGNSIPDQNYLFSGFPGKFCYSILDSAYKKGMSEAEGIELMKKCLDECKKRVIVNFTKFNVLVINKDGTRHLDEISF